jgi:anti-sigma B factor antagonist
MEAAVAAIPSSPHPELKLDIETSLERIIIRCSGKITSASVDSLLNTVRPLILQTKQIALDLAELRYMDSSGLGALVQLWATSKQAGTELAVMNLNKRIRDLLGVTNLSSIFAGQQKSGL